MPQFTLSELANNAGSSAANAGINLAKEAKGLACGLYKNYSGWATNLNLPTPPPAAFVKGVWDTVCADDPGGLPTPPAGPTFTGGQCECENYAVYGTLQFADSAPQQFFVAVRGPVYGARVIYDHNGSPTAVVECRGEYQSRFCNPPPYYKYVGATSAGSPDPKIIITSVSKYDGSVDNCGDPPAPPPNTSPPPPGALTKNVNITYNDGTDISVPLTFVQMNNNLDITVDVGGVGFNFNVDGVTFNWNQNSNNDYINGPGSGGGAGGGGVGGGGAGGDNNFVFNNKLDNITNKIENNLDVKLDDVILDVDLIKDTLDSAEDCCPEPPDPDTQTAIVCPIDDGATYSDIADLVSVKLNITKLPLSSKIQFGNSSPNVLFAGWLAFTHDGQAYEREPIHFEYNLFVPPKGANGFFYCLTNGAKGRVIYYVKT